MSEIKVKLLNSLNFFYLNLLMEGETKEIQRILSSLTLPGVCTLCAFLGLDCPVTLKLSFAYSVFWVPVTMGKCSSLQPSLL